MLQTSAPWRPVDWRAGRLFLPLTIAPVDDQRTEEDCGDHGEPEPVPVRLDAPLHEMLEAKHHEQEGSGANDHEAHVDMIPEPKDGE